MKRSFLILILLVISCSKDKNIVKNNPLTAIIWEPGSGDNGGCIGIIAYNGYPDYVCLDWEGGSEFAEEFVIYHSESENGDYSQIAQTSEKSYKVLDLEYGKSHFFYIIPHNSEYGDGPRSEIFKTYRSQKYNSTELFRRDGDRIIDFDVHSSEIYLLTSSLSTNNTELRIIDMQSGGILSVFDEPIVSTSNKILVSPNDDIYLFDRNGNTISKFNQTTRLVTAEINSDVKIDNIDIDKTNNKLYLTKENSTTVEVYTTELDLDFQFSVNPNFQKTRNMVIGNDAKVYVTIIDGVTEFGGDRYVLEVYSKEGMFLDAYELNEWGIDKINEVDKEGNIYSVAIGLGSSTFLYKYKLVGNKAIFVANLGTFALGDDFFKLDFDDNAYRAEWVEKIFYKISPAE